MVGPAAGWQMKVEFRSRHVPWFGCFGKAGCEPCTLEVPTCMYVIAAGLETSAVAAWHRITSTPERNPSCIVLNSTVSELHAN